MAGVLLSAGNGAMANLLIRNIDWVLTVDRERRMVRDGAIAIQGQSIAYVGPTASTPAGFRADQTLEGRGLVALPGLVDASVATVLQLGRGAGDNCDMPRFRLERSLACEGALSAEDALAASRACQIEMVRSGTTTFADSGSRFPEQVAAAAAESGLRALATRSCADVYDTFIGPFPDGFGRESAAEAIGRTGSAIRRDDAAKGRLRTGIAVPWLAACSDALLRDVAALARDTGARLIIGAGCARDDAVASRREHGKTEIARLAGAGLLGPATSISHAGWISPGDMRILADSGAHVVCCPASSHRQGTGALEYGRYPELLAFGVNVALGSGSAMAGNHADIARQLFLYCGSNMSLRLDATIASPESALEMATINGARALGLEAEIGSLEAGKKADVALFDAVASDWVPLINPVGNLAFSSRGGAHTVIADGEILLRAGRMQAIDEAHVLGQAQERAAALMQRSGLARFCEPAWPIE